MQHFKSHIRPIRTTPSFAAILVWLVLCVSASAQAQADLSGYWDLQVENGDGSLRETYFQLQQAIPAGANPYTPTVPPHGVVLLRLYTAQ
ncbi:MAG: hypothetical protein M3O02_08905 [Acidobacteriota bacterium]|nr:hypothetical protein [Acidobacteriota bacterium]